MFHSKMKGVRHFLALLLLMTSLWLTGCGELEFGVETAANNGLATATEVVGIPDNMVLVTVTPSRESTTATPTAVATQTPSATPVNIESATPTAVPSATSTKVPTPIPLTLPNPTATPAWAEILNAPFVSEAVSPGGSLTLNYNTLGESALLCLAPVLTEQWTCESVPLDGPHTITIDPTARTNLQLRLQAFTATTEAVATEVIMLLCAEDDWFFSGPPVTCPAGEPLETAAAYQPFEHGLMFWLEEGQWWEEGELIYILYDSPSQMFNAYPEQAIPSSDSPMPTNEYDPPEGLFVPESGFGILWRENSWIRQQLGWALSPEVGYTATAQRELTQSGYHLYLLDPEGRLIVLNFQNNSWGVRSQP